MTEKEKRMYLQQSLDTLRKNVELVGSRETLKTKYKTGYQKLIDTINKDFQEYRKAVFDGYAYDNEILNDKEIYKDIIIVHEREAKMLLDTTYDVEKVAAVYQSVIDSLVQLFPGCILLNGVRMYK